VARLAEWTVETSPKAALGATLLLPCAEEVEEVEERLPVLLPLPEERVRKAVRLFMIGRVE